MSAFGVFARDLHFFKGPQGHSVLLLNHRNQNAEL